MASRQLLNAILQSFKKLGGNTNEVLGTKTNVNFLGKGKSPELMLDMDLNEEALAILPQSKAVEELTSSVGYAVSNKLNDVQANKLLDKARLEHKSAYESGDSDRMLDAAESIADAKVELKTLESQKHLFDKEPEPVPAYPSVQAPQPVQQQQQPAQQPDPRALQWAQSNKWVGENAAMTGAAYAIDAQLKMEGYNPSSEDYYSELDRRIGESFPAKTAKAKPKQVVAGVTRAQSAPKRVSLTKSQIAMANKLGVPPSEYAKFVRNTNE